MKTEISKEAYEDVFRILKEVRKWSYMIDTLAKGSSNILGIDYVLETIRSCQKHLLSKLLLAIDLRERAREIRDAIAPYEAVLVASSDIECNSHPPPSTLAYVWCQHCGAYKINPDGRLYYVMKQS